MFNFNKEQLKKDFLKEQKEQLKKLKQDHKKNIQLLKKYFPSYNLKNIESPSLKNMKSYDSKTFNKVFKKLVSDFMAAEFIKFKKFYKDKTGQDYNKQLVFYISLRPNTLVVIDEKGIDYSIRCDGKYPYTLGYLLDETPSWDLFFKLAEDKFKKEYINLYKTEWVK